MKQLITIFLFTLLLAACAEATPTPVATVTPERLMPATASVTVTPSVRSLTPVPTPTSTVIPPASATAALCQAGQINVNTASLVELMAIRHIGHSRGQAVIMLRPFKSLDELTRVPGIGPVRLQDIKDEGRACAEHHDPDVSFLLTPGIVLLDEGEVVDVIIRLETPTPGTLVTVAQAYLDFDPTILQVVDPATGLPTDSITLGPIFSSHNWVLLQNQVDNTVGTISFSGGKKPPIDDDPGGSDVPTPAAFAMFRLKALAPATHTTITFSTTVPRQTRAISGIADVTGGLVGMATVEDICQVMLDEPRATAVRLGEDGSASDDNTAVEDLLYHWDVATRPATGSATILGYLSSNPLVAVACVTGPGEYGFELTITDQRGLQGKDRVEVTVTE